MYYLHFLRLSDYIPRNLILYIGVMFHTVIIAQIVLFNLKK